MIQAIDFENMKALRNVTLPMGRFTLLVGPNGSGKSSVLEALLAVRDHKLDYAPNLSAGGKPNSAISITIHWELSLLKPVLFKTTFSANGVNLGFELAGGGAISPTIHETINPLVASIRAFTFDPAQVAAAVALAPNMELEANGRGFAGVLDRLRDEAPERFEEINTQLGRWLPEFNRILFHTPAPGRRAFSLRTVVGGYSIPAAALSQGTLISLAMLCLAYLPNPPSVICLEEPDRGLHPRLLREVQDALYRLCYPESVGEKRKPVQVIATTHNPYFLDLFREHPEEVVITQKDGLDVSFQRLSDRADVKEILEGASLGEVWYTGVLGGVPATP